MKGAGEIIENETKQQKQGIHPMSMGTLAFILLGGALAGNKVVTGGDRVI